MPVGGLALRWFRNLDGVFVGLLTNLPSSEVSRKRAPLSAWVLLYAMGMHATTFAIKRAHLLSLTMLRGHLKPFAALGVTPARFDLLNLILTAHPYAREIRQRDIHRRLGVARATVSRMLVRLENMGLIGRHPLDVDRRMKTVRLSRIGRAAMRILINKIMKARVVDGTLRGVLRAAPGEMRRPHATLFTDLGTFARRMGDSAKSPYIARVIGERPQPWPWPSIRRWTSLDPADERKFPERVRRVRSPQYRR